MGRRDIPVDPSQGGIGAAMRRARQSAGVSLTDMARQVAYTKGYLSAVENGMSRPSSALISGYERELRLEPGTLAGPGISQARSSRTDDASKAQERAHDATRLQSVPVIEPSAFNTPPSLGVLHLAGSDVWEQLTLQREAEIVWRQVEGLIDEFKKDPEIAPELQLALAEFIRSGLLAFQQRR